MESSDKIQGRNDRHFFTVVGIGIGIGIGIGLAATADKFPGVKDWQPLIASLVAVFAAFIALYNVRLQIAAGIRKDELARAAEREARIEEELRSTKVHRDCAAMVGQVVGDLFANCRVALEARIDILAAGHDWLTPVKPPSLGSYRGARKVWNEMYRSLVHEAKGGLTKAGESIATTLLSIADRVVEITDAHEKLVSVHFVSSMPDYSQSEEALLLIEHFMVMADELRRGVVY